MDSKIKHVNVIPRKSRPLPGMPRLLTELVFTRILKSQDSQIPNISNFQIRIFAIMDAEMSKIKSQMFVFEKVSELAILRLLVMKIYEFECLSMCWPRVTLFG